VSYIYLASPYSDPSETVREARYREVMKAAATMFNYKIAVYSPIVAWHEVAKHHTLPTDAASYVIQNDAFMEHCEEGWFLDIPGLFQSKGCMAERDFLVRHEVQVRVIKPQEVAALCLTYITEKLNGR
jgi:hypothetical protein